MSKNIRYNDKVKSMVSFLLLLILIFSFNCVITRGEANIKYKLEESWGDEGAYYAKFNVIIENNDSSELKDWRADIIFESDIKLVQNWNTNAQGEGNKLSMTAVEYNKTIASKSSIDFGMIVEGKAKPTISSIALSAGDKTVDGAEDNGNSSEKNENLELKEISVNLDRAFATLLGIKIDIKKDIEKETSTENTPVALHGKLNVKGTQIVDSKGDPFILKGVSTHGIAWFPDYINKGAFQTMRDSWGVNTVRLALYSSEGEGYNTSLHAKVDEGVKYATELGMYVIIDWHILSNGNPNTDKDKALEFFNEMTDKYKDYDNVIYEICNEPNGDVTWSRDIKPYATEMISAIRQVDSDAIIIVGTPTWSQDVDIVADDYIAGYGNIMYALHFYAATHTDNLRDKLVKALDSGLPIIVSEFGICDASGNGKIDEGQADRWIELLNSRGVGYVCWNLSNKNEASALIKSDCDKKSGWSTEDLSEQGKWLVKTYNK